MSRYGTSKPMAILHASIHLNDFGCRFRIRFSPVYWIIYAPRFVIVFGVDLLNWRLIRGIKSMSPEQRKEMRDALSRPLSTDSGEKGES